MITDKFIMKLGKNVSSLLDFTDKYRLKRFTSCFCFIFGVLQCDRRERGSIYASYGCLFRYLITLIQAVLLL